MNEDIKEILQTLDGISSGDWIQMLPKEATKLLNYITNLQEENCKLRETNEEHRKINGDLRKENQKLVKVIDGLEEWLVKIINDDRTNNSVVGTLLYVLNKLTELKGGSDEQKN